MSDERRMIVLSKDIEYGYDSDLGYWNWRYFCGVQWNAFEAADEADAKANAERIERARRRWSYSPSLDEALNSGDGSYRP